MLVLAATQLYMAHQILVTTATRDFDFGPPLMIMLAALQIIVSLMGIAHSIGRK
jgi:hypothetical protein